MRYWIDGKDRIAEVDEAWLLFATANGAPDLTPAHVRGCPLASFISDPTTAHLWTLILARVREGIRVDITIRCDAPDHRRIFLLHLSHEGAEQILIESETILDEERISVGLFEVDREHSRSQVSVCSWCKRVLVPPDRWSEVEIALVELGLLEKLQLPEVTHGICDRCVARARTEAGLAPS